MKGPSVYSDDSASYDEDEYDRLNDATFGTSALNMNPKGFSFNIAENKYRAEIKGEDTETFNESLNDDQKHQSEEVTNFMNLSLNKSKEDDQTAIDPKEDEVNAYRPSIVDQFFLWIHPHPLYMLSDLHNMSCRKMKLFNFTHIVPTLEDKMLNRIKIKFHPSKYLFGVDMANMVQLFQRKLAECSSLIPFNCDYYYWERVYRLNPNAYRVNRMLIADDMWLPPVVSTFELGMMPSHLQNRVSKPKRPPTFKYENTLGSVSLSSVQFPRKILSCDPDNNDEINRINNSELFSDIQKRYYVLSLIDRAIRLTIDYEIKNRVVTYQIQNKQKIEYKPQEMIQFQMSLGDFILKISPLYPFILNYGQGIDLFNRIFFLLTDIHKVHVSKGVFEALKSNKVHPDQYPIVFDNDCLVNVIMFGLGDVNEIDNHLRSVDFFMKIETLQLNRTLFFWRLLEMVHTWLIPTGYTTGAAPPPEYTLRFMCLLSTAIQSIQTKHLKSKKLNAILAAQQKILIAIKGINFNLLDSSFTKRIIDVKDYILKNFAPSRIL